MDTFTIDRTESELHEIHIERRRQEKLKAEGRFSHTPADGELELPEPFKLAMIVEELGEVGRNVLARSELVTDGDTNDEALHKELCQVAALAVAWMERLTWRMEGDARAGVH